MNANTARRWQQAQSNSSRKGSEGVRGGSEKSVAIAAVIFYNFKFLFRQKIIASDYLKLKSF